MKVEYITKKSKTNWQRRLLIEDWSPDKSTISKAVLTAIAVALLPAGLKLIVLVGQQLLTALSK